MGTGRSGLPRGVRNTTNAVKKLLGEQGAVVRRYDGSGIEEQDFKNTYLKDANPNRDNYLSATSSRELNRLYDQYHKNCQRACYATDLRLAGYDVEALPRTKDNDYALADATLPKSFLNVYDGAAKNFVPVGGDSVSDIVTQLKTLLPQSGARAIVHNYWATGGGHAWNIIRSGNNIWAIDGQTNKVFDVANYIKESTNYSSMFGSTYAVSGKHCINVLVTNRGGGSNDIYTPTGLLKDFVKKRNK
jgi:hypothetical protein